MYGIHRTITEGYIVQYYALIERWLVQVNMERGVLGDHSKICDIPRSAGTTIAYDSEGDMLSPVHD